MSQAPQKRKSWSGGGPGAGKGGGAGAGGGGGGGFGGKGDCTHKKITIENVRIISTLRAKKKKENRLIDANLKRKYQERKKKVLKTPSIPIINTLINLYRP